MFKPEWRSVGGRLRLLSNRTKAANSSCDLIEQAFWFIDLFWQLSFLYFLHLDMRFVTVSARAQSNAKIGHLETKLSWTVHSVDPQTMSISCIALNSISWLIHY